MGLNERFDLLDEQGQAIGVTKARWEVHRDGDWHRTVHVWLMNPLGELLLQHRGSEQESNPNLWDVSSAGHCLCGDSAEATAVRELDEELGWCTDVDKLIQLGELKSVWRQQGLIDREFSVIFLLKIDDVRPELNLQIEEVQAVKWVSWQTLRLWVGEGAGMLVEHDKEYELLFGFLEENSFQ